MGSFPCSCVLREDLALDFRTTGRSKPDCEPGLRNLGGLCAFTYVWVYKRTIRVLP